MNIRSSIIIRRRSNTNESIDSRSYISSLNSDDDEEDSEDEYDVYSSDESDIS